MAKEFKDIDYVQEGGAPIPSSIINALIEGNNEKNKWIKDYMADHPEGTDISQARVIGLKPRYEFAGEPIMPNVTLYFGGKELQLGEHFIADYRNNDAIGTATVTYLGKFPYTGELEKTFSIEGKKYRLSFNVDAYAAQGISVPADKIISNVTSADLVSPGTIPYYTFVGWFDAPTGGTQFTGGTLSNDKTVYARYKQDQYDITFVSAQGTAPAKITTGAIPDLTKPAYKLDAKGYAFGGWFLDEDYEEPAVSGTPIESDVILYAKWVSLEATLTIAGDTIKASCADGATIELRKDGEVVESGEDTLTSSATYSTVVSANGKSQSCVIVVTYDKDNETLDVTSPAGNVTVVKLGQSVSLPIHLYEGEGSERHFVGAGLYTIVDEASNTGSIEITE